MNPYLELIPYLCNPEIYKEYRPYIELDKSVDKEIHIIYKALDDVLSKGDTTDPQDIKRLVRETSYRFAPSKSFSNLEAIYSKTEVLSTGSDDKDVPVLLHSLKTRGIYTRLGEECFNLAAGDGDIERFRSLTDEINASIGDLDSIKPDRNIISKSLEELFEATIKNPGLRWRLSSLNKSLGSLRKGNFMFVFARPESFSSDTEVLTAKGWLYVDKVTYETDIAQVSENRTITFTKPQLISTHEQDTCMHIHDSLGRVDLIVTNGHGMVIEKNGKIGKARADEVMYYQGVKHHVSGFGSGEKLALTAQERLAIAYQADGAKRKYKNNLIFSFKKQSKVDRLSNILGKCRYEYSLTEQKGGYKYFYIKTNANYVKDFSWVDLSKISYHWAREFIEELSYWDATRRTNTRFKFDTTKEDVANTVQAIAILAGYNCFMSKVSDNRKDTYSDIYSLTIRTNYSPVDGQSIKKESIEFKDTTYCFTVPNGALIVRRNYAPAVCGNTGKTTFLASEITHMVQQTDRPILWFNNEEQGEIVLTRCYQAALGVTIQELMENREEHERKFIELTNGNIKIYDSASIHRRDVERVCETHQPALVVFDQIDKLQGFIGDREDLRLGSVYQWARELAKRFAPVIGITQADGGAEGKKWLDMADVMNAKTAKQAEADAILGIGKVPDPQLEFIRFLNISKNKLFGDSDSLPELRHGRLEVLIQPEIARYKDLI